jgi:hypothetical protein
MLAYDKEERDAINSELQVQTKKKTKLEFSHRARLHRRRHRVRLHRRLHRARQR